MCPSFNYTEECTALQQLLTMASFDYEMYKENDDSFGTKNLLSKTAIGELCKENQIPFKNRMDIQLSFNKKCLTFKPSVDK